MTKATPENTPDNRERTAYVVEAMVPIKWMASSPYDAEGTLLNLVGDFDEYFGEGNYNFVACRPATQEDLEEYRASRPGVPPTVVH